MSQPTPRARARGALCRRADPLFVAFVFLGNLACGRIAYERPSGNDGSSVDGALSDAHAMDGASVDAAAIDGAPLRDTRSPTDALMDARVDAGGCGAGFRRAADAGCVDVDECAESLDDCDANAQCANRIGGFDCTCEPGFMGDGRYCTSIVFDGVSTCPSGVASEIGWSHPIGAGADRIVVVLIAINPANVGVSSLTVDGLPLTQMGAVSDAANARGEIWRIREVTGLSTGSANVQLSLSGSAAVACAAASFGGVSQADTLNWASAGGSENLTIVSTSGAGDVVLSLIVTDQCTPLGQAGPAGFVHLGGADAGPCAQHIHTEWSYGVGGPGRHPTWYVPGVTLRGGASVFSPP